MGCGTGQLRHKIEPWEEVARRLEIREGKPHPILRGRDLIPLGFETGPDMGKILHAAYEAQLDGLFSNLTEAIAWLHDNNVMPK